MPRESYQDQLTVLRGQVAAMAETTLERHEMACDVLETGDEQQATRVIEGDQDLNEWYLNIEGDCIELLALQQPVAGDLRFIASSFKIVTDLERIGDLATNLARYGREAEGDLLNVGDVLRLAERSKRMVSDAMAAYERDDTEAARDVATRDDDLDATARNVSEQLARTLLTTHHSKSDQIETTLADVSRALLAIRDIERVGDHAVNICARTVYMVENDDELLY